MLRNKHVYSLVRRLLYGGVSLGGYECGCLEMLAHRASASAPLTLHLSTCWQTTMLPTWRQPELQQGLRTALQNQLVPVMMPFFLVAWWLSTVVVTAVLTFKGHFRVLALAAGCSFNPIWAALTLRLH